MSIFPADALARAGYFLSRRRPLSPFACRRPLSTLSAAILLGLPVVARAQLAAAPLQLATADSKAMLERVEVVGIRLATMPTEIPTTTQSISARQIEQTINATDSEDALKYFPSLSVRKRYIGDYDHAVLATRASGNSAGAVVDFVTRMPKQFEAHAKLQGFTQNFKVYGTEDRFSGGSGRQYGTLDNSDPNGATYTGVGRFLVADVPVQYRVNRQWSVAAGIDNLGNQTCWAFPPVHPAHVQRRTALRPLITLTP